jgi:hypothetical protein
MNVDDNILDINKMLNRDIEQKKALDLEMLHFQRTNPCYTGKIDYSNEKLKKTFTQKECDALHGKYNPKGGVCIRDNVNLSNLCASKIKSLPKECLNLGKNDKELSKVNIKGNQVELVKRIYTKEECTKLGGIINEKNKHCENKKNNIDWSIKCGKEIKKNSEPEMKPWGTCVPEKKTGKECKKELDKKILDLKNKYLNKEKIDNKNEEIKAFKDCLAKKKNFLQCDLDKIILKQINDDKLKNIKTDQTKINNITNEYIDTWKARGKGAYEKCLVTGDSKQKCEATFNIWDEIIEYTFRPGVKDSDLDAYQAKRMKAELAKTKTLNVKAVECAKKSTTLRCNFNKYISQLQNKSSVQFSVADINDELENFIYIQKRDGLFKKNSPSYYLRKGCELELFTLSEAREKNQCKFLQESWPLIIDFAIQENKTDDEVQIFMNGLNVLFLQREKDFFKCLETSNNFKCGLEYKIKTNQDKSKTKLSKEELVEDANQFVIDFKKERIDNCKKNTPHKECDAINAIWDDSFISKINVNGITDNEVDNMESKKMIKVQNLLQESPIKNIEKFGDVYGQTSSWTSLIQIILLLGIFFYLMKFSIKK